MATTDERNLFQARTGNNLPFCHRRARIGRSVKEPVSSGPQADSVICLFVWAHDFDPDRPIVATFQALPGASFVVNGAPPR
jgi:hypothetical protein